MRLACIPGYWPGSLIFAAHWLGWCLKHEFTREGRVDLRISLAGDNDSDHIADFESLYSWLWGEPALAGCVAEDRRVPLPGEMGGLSDALIVSVGSGGAVSALALSLKAFLSQPRAANIRIHIQGEGREVDITADNIRRNQADDLLRQVIDGIISSE